MLFSLGSSFSNLPMSPDAGAIAPKLVLLAKHKYSSLRLVKLFKLDLVPSSGPIVADSFLERSNSMQQLAHQSPKKLQVLLEHLAVHYSR